MNAKKNSSSYLLLDEYEQIKEDQADLAVVADRRNEKTISLDQLKNGNKTGNRFE